MSEHAVSNRTNVIVYVLLMLLLLATVGAAYLPLERVHFLIAMTIAVVKAVLILLFFMHVKGANRVVWVFAGAAFLWLGILIALSLNDYLTRGWLNIPGK